MINNFVSVDVRYRAVTQAGYDMPASGDAYGCNIGVMRTAWFFQLYGGIRPTDKLDIMASVSYANAVVKPTINWVNNDYGYEVDLTATYKIASNLSYRPGGGCLFTGKYFKGTSVSNEIRDDFPVISRLMPTFQKVDSHFH